MNSDIIICDAAVDKLIKYADEHPEAAVVTCQVWKNREAIQMTCFRFPSVLKLLLSGPFLARVFKYNRLFGREWMLWWGRDSEREVDVVSGMFLLVRRTAIEKVGMMDESFFLYYEETDWCRRFVGAGWKILFWLGTKVIHLDGGGQSSQRNAAEMFAQRWKSMLQYFRKHHGRLACLVARSLIAVSYGMRLFAWHTIVFMEYITGKSTLAAKEESHKCWRVIKMCLADS